jgi:hypothetical protein
MKQAENITEMLSPAPKAKEVAGDEQTK